MFEPKKSLLTVRRAVWLILRKPEEQSDSDSEAIALLKQQGGWQRFVNFTPISPSNLL